MPHRSHPVVAQKGPYVVELEPDKIYFIKILAFVV